MTPGQAQWSMWLFGAVCGWIATSIIGVPALAWLLASLHRDERTRLRAVLEDLVGAVEACPRLTGEPNRWLGIALKRARDVLGGKGAE